MFDAKEARNPEKTATTLSRFAAATLRPVSEEPLLARYSAEDFIQAIGRINRIVRERPIAHKSELSSQVTLSVPENYPSYHPPSLKHKVPLLKEGFAAAQSIVSRKLAAELLHHVIVLVHPFSDGNGRTARVVADFVRSNGSPSDELASLLGESATSREVVNKRFHASAEEMFRWASKREVKKLSSFDPENADVFRSADGLYVIGNPSDYRPKGTQIESWSRWGLLKELSWEDVPTSKAAFIEFASGNEQFQGLVRVQPTTSNSGEPFSLLRMDGEKMLPFLSEREAERIIERVEELKVLSLRHLINVFVEWDRARREPR